MVLLFLESIGTTELLVILVVALVVFGPRRLPELGRKLGKSMAEFKRASDDFKRTWEREVDLDRYERERKLDAALPPAEDSPAAFELPAPDDDALPADAPPLVVAESPNSIARGPRAAAAPAGLEADAGEGGAGAPAEAAAGQAEQSARKSDWL